VRAIFRLYLERQALVPVVQELERRAWFNKRWVTRKGRRRGGRPFTKPRLYELLTNVLYVGKVRHKRDVHDGEHAAIVPAALWDQVQAVLTQNGGASAGVPRSPTDALLQGLLRCVTCGCAMTPSHATKRGSRRYRYYLCTEAQKRGRHTCPASSLPAAEIERFVLDQLRALGHQPAGKDEAGGDVGLREVVRFVQALVQRVDYDGACDKITIRLHPVDLQAPVDESLSQPQEA
jgi:site-specific DNA recombinase